VVLIHCPDLSAADWIVRSDQPRDQLVRFGPGGFPAYARLRFLPDPAYVGQDRDQLDVDTGPFDEEPVLRVALTTLARHTGTPDDSYFCLWDGWGGIKGGDVMRLADFQTGSVTRGPLIEPAFPPSVLLGPTVEVPRGRTVPSRAYYLFRGPISDLGDWGAADEWPGRPRRYMPPPALVWPADHAWCIANDVDPHWAGIGASVAAIDELLADPRLDLARDDPAQEQPYYL
jgi:hypothetical protein